MTKSVICLNERKTAWTGRNAERRPAAGGTEAIRKDRFFEYVGRKGSGDGAKSARFASTDGKTRGVENPIEIVLMECPQFLTLWTSFTCLDSSNSLDFALHHICV